jgi:serine phosphatase RsbU (regulator of sigma subunit)
MVLYTDGLTERRNEVIDRGMERIRALIADHVTSALDDLVTATANSVDRPQDDLAILAVRFE